MNQELLMFMAEGNKSIPLDEVINTLFPDKHDIIRQAMVDYLVASGVAVFSEEDHIATSPIEGAVFGKYVIHPADMVPKMMPALVSKYPSLSMEQPQIQQTTAPVIELSGEPQEEIDRRDRIEILRKLIDANPSALELHNGNLVSSITQKEMWEMLNNMAGRQLFWKLPTFKIYCGTKNGTMCSLINVRSIVWMQDKAKR